MGEDGSIKWTGSNQEAGGSAKKPKQSEPHLKSKRGTNRIMNSKNEQILTTKDGDRHLSWCEAATKTLACRSPSRPTRSDQSLTGSGPWWTRSGITTSCLVEVHRKLKVGHSWPDLDPPHRAAEWRQPPGCSHAATRRRGPTGVEEVDGHAAHPHKVTP
jgi:hypothetical protein